MSLIKKGGTKILGQGAAEPPQTGPDETAQIRDDATKNIPPTAPATGGSLPRIAGGTTKHVGAGVTQLPEDATKNVSGDAPPPADDATKNVTPAVPAAKPAPPARGTPPPARKAASNDDEGSKRKAAFAQTLAAGTMLQQRYQIENVLGIGGMSVVYRGRDTRLKFGNEARVCAIKEMYQSAADTQTRTLNLRLFEREAGLLATLSHPTIPKVSDFFEENGRVYLVMELINGQDLDQVLQEAGKPIAEARVVHWAMQICDVLSYLHNLQPNPIVFRDMKPSNIVVTPEERIVLIDFGIARLLERGGVKGTMIGTEGYAPPEQYRGIAEAQSDIYALGATLHHLLTNDDPRLQTPFTFHERPIRNLNPAVSADVAGIIEKALEYDMAKRWATAEELKQAFLSLGVVGSASSLPYASSAGSVSTAAKPVRSRSSAPSTELVWAFTCEDEVRSSPRIQDNMLYIGCYDTNLYALDVHRGEFRWKYATEGGIPSTADVWENIVITGSEDGKVYGLDTRTGKPLWTFRTEQPIRSSPRVHERRVFVASDDLHLYALDGARGSLLWKYRFWSPSRSTAWVNGDALYIGGGDGFVYCIETKNGGVRWKQRTQQPVISSPIYHEGAIYVGSSDNNLYALDAEGGFAMWRFRTGHAVNSSPIVVGSRVYVGSADGNLYGVERKNGRLAWKYETGSQITSSPRHHNGRIYIGAIDGNVYAVDASDGRLVWVFPTGAPVVSTPAIHNDVVYIGSLDYKVYALRA